MIGASCPEVCARLRACVHVSVYVCEHVCLHLCVCVHARTCGTQQDRGSQSAGTRWGVTPLQVPWVAETRLRTDASLSLPPALHLSVGSPEVSKVGGPAQALDLRMPEVLERKPKWGDKPRSSPGNANNRCVLPAPVALTPGLLFSTAQSSRAGSQERWARVLGCRSSL